MIIACRSDPVEAQFQDLLERKMVGLLDRRAGQEDVTRYLDVTSGGIRVKNV